MSSARLEAVIWDMDGVIADTVDYHYRAWEAVFRERGVAFTMAEFLPFFGRRHDDIIRYALGDSLPPSGMQAVNESKQALYRRLVTGHVKALPGVVALLKSLNAHRVKVAMGTSAVPDNVDVIITSLGIADCFQAIAYGTEVPAGKPSPDIFLLAAKKLGVKPGGCVVFEDAVAGVAAAKAGGMKCVAVTNTHPAERLRQADLVVDSLEKVDIKVLKSLFTAWHSAHHEPVEG